MFLDKVFNSPGARALELRAQFAEKRQELLAENIANIHTPGYRVKRLDPAAFDRELRTAVEAADDDGSGEVELTQGPARTTGPGGKLELFPETEPAGNVLFHDDTSARLEELLVDAQQNALDYASAIQLLKGKNDGLMQAIRGRNS